MCSKLLLDSSLSARNSKYTCRISRWLLAIYISFFFLLQDRYFFINYSDEIKLWSYILNFHSLIRLNFVCDGNGDDVKFE